MFSNLTNFSFRRTTKQAVGFYLAYLLVFMLSAGITAAILGAVLNKNHDLAFGVRVGTLFAVVACFSLTTVMVYKKNLSENVMYILLTILAAVLALLGGGLLGLIPAAYLSKK